MYEVVSCGFCRVKLYKEERKTLQVHIPGEAFTVVDEEGRHIAGGKHYTIYAGFSQPDAKSEELMGMTAASNTSHSYEVRHMNATPSPFLRP